MRLRKHGASHKARTFIWHIAVGFGPASTGFLLLISTHHSFAGWLMASSGVGNINQTTLLLKLTSAFCHHSSPMVIEEFIPIEKWIYIYMVTPRPRLYLYTYISYTCIYTKCDTPGGRREGSANTGSLWIPVIPSRNTHDMPISALQGA